VTDTPRYLTLGFIASGLVNVFGALIFTRGFSSNALGELYPEVCSRFGMVVVIVWGLAYLAVARRPPAMLCFVFAIEKAVYVASWLYWMLERGSELPAIWSRDPLSATFLAIYGINDLAFGVFFARCGLKLRN